MAAGIPLVFYGIIYHLQPWGKALIVIGAVLSLSALIGWSMEPLEEEHEPDAGPGDEVAAEAGA
jgi:hypothetical protein